MEVTKSVTVLENGDGTLGVGDTVKYLIKVQNTGNVNLTGPTLVDTFTDASGKVINLTSGPTFDFADQGSSQDDQAIGECLLQCYILGYSSDSGYRRS